MALSSLIQHLKNSKLTRELIERIKREDRLLVKGAGRTSKALLTTAIAKSENKPLLVIVPTLEEAARWFSILKILGWEKTYLYPTSESSPYEGQDSNNEIIWGQLQVLSELLTNKSNNNIAIVSTERSLQPHLPPKGCLSSCCINLTKGADINIDSLSNELAELGYIRKNSIEIEGQWARRGDIIDIFPVNSELPIRLELFGEELEKIREFDPASQRSLDQIEEICITPTCYTPLIANRLRENTPINIDQLLDDISFEKLINGETPDGLKRLMGLAWNNPNTLLDYIAKNTCLVVDEKDQGLAHGENWFIHAEETFKEFTKSITGSTSGEFNYPGKLHISIIKSFDNTNQFFGFELSELDYNANHPNKFDLSSSLLNSYPNNFSKIAQQIKEFRKDKVKIWIFSAQPTRTVSLLEEHECPSRFVSNPNDYQGIERIVADNVPIAFKNSSNSEIEGLILKAWKVALITDKEIFGQQNLNSIGYIRRRRVSASSTVNPNRMKPGDYVVHRNHGIGRFLKIQKNAISGQIRDYLVVEYLDGKLSVAADQLGSLGRYRATDGKSPKINKMGGASWKKLKERTKKQIQKIAIDLVRLYAERSRSKGYAFPKDGPWQIELEDSFPHEPTPDQRQAVIDVKEDMEKEKPMDRLVCGDVGYGKTEVAVRAIFKAITSGKQVALLAPTTILAQQHWRTIADRFAPYPIKVSLLNRFKSNTEKKEILIGLREGKIDAVIGTHQILSKTIEFKQLGLLVIDEEQRFGVNHKERIKNLKKDVDVLTLSATPIPRTLYMSLSGVREMSLITTPPPLRRAIKTHLAPIDNETIRSAICQELDRGGQIFYVLPRIEGIEDCANKLKQMVPKLKLLIAHGQMNEGELENAMIAFNAGEVDLMLCTTIIESGLDIPKVNTILIEDGHKFGLSQLYQLRGRVGRSGVQAHAWIFYPSASALNDSARQRLKAIQEFSQLGSGYQLAMRDMEIRGVGNILGVQQSGQMETIGFELYMELLQESLAEIQGQNIPLVDETQIDLKITAFIPADWIVNTEEKISAYRQATECVSNQKIIELAATWTDKYGKLPTSVETLLEIMKLKLLSKRCGFYRIRQDKNNVIFDTRMEKPAFSILQQAIPKHLQGRFIYQNVEGLNSCVIGRGLGVLPSDKKIEQLIYYLSLMSERVPSSDGTSLYEKNINNENKNKEVIVT